MLDISKINYTKETLSESKGYQAIIQTTLMERRSMPVCFTEKQFKMIEEFAKRNGMLNASQALEKILNH